MPLSSQLASRAHRLAAQAIGALPPFRGYIGIDMILGHCQDGSGDVAVEINPRLTSSYVGLKRLLENNLAQSMLDVAHGRQWQPRIATPSLDFEIL